MLETVAKLKDSLTNEMQTRADDDAKRAKAIDGSLQNVYFNLQQERQLREEEVAALQTSVYNEANVRLAENTQLTELFDRLAQRCVGDRRCLCHTRDCIHLANYQLFDRPQ